MAENSNNFSKRLLAILPLLVIGALAIFTFLFSNALASGISPGEVIQYVNRARSEAGLSPVKENAILSRAAEAKARDMVKEDYFAHTSPDGKTPWYWLKEAGYRYKTAGENLAINYSNAKEQHSAWMKSTTHRANILNGKYTEIGVAVVEGKIDGESSLVTVQFFGAPMVAVADQTKSVVATPEKSLVPAIQGEEIDIALPETVTPTPAAEEEWAPQSVTPSTPSLSTDQLARSLELGTLITSIILAVALVLSPFAFISRAILTLWSSFRAKKEEENDEVPIEVKTLHSPTH